MRTMLAVLAVATGMVAPGSAAERLPGPVPARVLAVLDGDTLRVRARIWLDQEVEVSVRLGGIDAPELHGRCSRERRMARAARAFVERAVAGAGVSLRDIRYGKFARRVVARVATVGGTDVASALLVRGLARPYAGGRRGGWCAGPDAP